MQTLVILTAESQSIIKTSLTVGFFSAENVVRESYFKIKINEKQYDFQVVGIKAEGSFLKITAKEVGYWATTLDKQGTDLRTLIGVAIEPVTDEQEIKQIKENSSYC